jgi:hypothetical protein
MPAEGFEPTIPASERPQIKALDSAATGVGWFSHLLSRNLGILWYDAVSLGDCFLTFRRIVASYSSGKQSRFFLEYFTLEDEGCTMLLKVGNHSPNGTAFHSRRRNSSATLLWKPQITHFLSCSQHMHQSPSMSEGCRWSLSAPAWTCRELCRFYQLVPRYTVSTITVCHVMVNTNPGPSRPPLRHTTPWAWRQPRWSPSRTLTQLSGHEGFWPLMNSPLPLEGHAS